jgi:hypothetical protein
MLGSSANRSGRSVWTSKTVVCDASSAGPGEIAAAQPATTCAAASSSTCWSAPPSKVGASFAGVTVIVTVRGSLASAPSLARYWKLSVPLKSAAGT